MSNIADMSLNQMADKAKQTAHDIQEKAKDKFNEVGEKTEEGLNKAAQKIQDEAADINKAIHDYVKAKPLTALAIAAGIGALLGSLITK